MSNKHFYDWLSLTDIINKMSYRMYSMACLMKNFFHIKSKIKKKITTSLIIYITNQILYEVVFINFNFNVLQ